MTDLILPITGRLIPMGSSGFWPKFKNVIDLFPKEKNLKAFRLQGLPTIVTKLKNLGFSEQFVMVVQRPDKRETPVGYHMIERAQEMVTIRDNWTCFCYEAFMGQCYLVFACKDQVDAVMLKMAV